MTKNYEPAKPFTQSLFTETAALESLVAQGRLPIVSEAIVIENGVPRRKHELTIPAADDQAQSDEYQTPISALDAHKIKKYLDLFG